MGRVSTQSPISAIKRDAVNTGVQRPLSYVGRLSESNHGDILSKALQASAEDGFELYIPSKSKLQVAGWKTPEVEKPLRVALQQGTVIESDYGNDFIQSRASVHLAGQATLKGFGTAVQMKKIQDDIELFIQGLRGEGVTSLISMRHVDNAQGSLLKAVIKDVFGKNLSGWGIDISPAVFGDISIVRARLEGCKTRFIGIGNNASGENYSKNQIVRIHDMIGDGLTEQDGVGELQGLYVTGCQNVMVTNPDIRNLAYTESAVDAEGIYIKAANTTIQSPRLLNAGGNQGVIVVKGSAPGKTVKSTANITDAVITSTYGTDRPTCPLYVQADDVSFDGTLRGTFTRPIHCNEVVPIERLKIDAKWQGVVTDKLVRITPNVVSVDVIPEASEVTSLYADRPVVVELAGASGSDNKGKQANRRVSVKRGMLMDFKKHDGTEAGALVDIDMTGDESASFGKLSVIDNDLNNLTYSVKGTRGKISALISKDNDLTGGASAWTSGGVEVTGLTLEDNITGA